MTEPAATTTATTTAAPPSGGADWKALGLDADQQAWVGTKGYKSAGDLVKAAHSLEQQLGADKLALPVKGANGVRDFAGWTGWRDLGVPEKAEGYALADGTVADPATLGWFRRLAHQHNVPAGAFRGLVEGYNARMTELVKEHDAEIARASTAVETALKQKWGAAYEPKMQRIATLLPAAIAEDMQKSLRQSTQAMEWLDRIAEHFGEDGAMIAGGGNMLTQTPDQAKAEIAKIEGEARGNPKHAYNDALHPEHAAVIEKLRGLYALAFPEAA